MGVVDWVVRANRYALTGDSRSEAEIYADNHTWEETLQDAPSKLEAAEFVMKYKEHYAKTYDAAGIIEKARHGYYQDD